jgi:hypothetical protein
MRCCVESNLLRSLVVWKMKGTAATTITLSPEQERLLAEVVAAGLADTPDDAIDKAVRALHDSASVRTPNQPKAENLSDLLLDSPFSGANLNLERCQDYPRPVEIE